MRLLLFVLVAVQCAFAHFPEAPSATQKVDKAFLAVTTYHMTALYLDSRSTTIALRNPACSEQWSSWVVGKRPSARRLYLTGAATWVGASSLSYFLKKKKKRWWWVPQAAIATAHTTASAMNRYGSGCY